MQINETRTQIVDQSEQSKKVRGEISLPNISGTPGVLVKDPITAGRALDDALGVFAEIYSTNGIGAQNEITFLTGRVDRMKQGLMLIQEGALSQEKKRKARKDVINFLRNASDFYAESQKRKTNGNGANGKVVFDSSQLQRS